MAGWSKVQGTSSLTASPGGSVGLAPVSNLSAGNVLVAGVTANLVGLTPTIADGGSNSWGSTPYLGTFSSSTASFTTALFFCTVNAGSDGTKPTVTVSALSTASSAGLWIAEFAPPAGPVTQDGTGATNQSAGIANPIALPAANGSGANDLIVAVYVLQVGWASWGGAWASFDSVNNSRSGHICGYLLNAAGNSASNVSQASNSGYSGLVAALSPPGVTPMFAAHLPFMVPQGM